VKVGDRLQESGENVFVGGKNRWKYADLLILYILSVFFIMIRGSQSNNPRHA